MINKDIKFLIVGLGLIGGSYAEGLTKNGYYVGAINLDKESIDYGLEKGIIKEGTTTPSKKFISKYDIIVLALYPHSVVKWIDENQKYIKKNALITDVTGVKGAIIYEIEKILRPDLEFIGAHPMAGREVYGVKNSNCDIFKGANYIVTPTKKNSYFAVETCSEIGHILGFKNIAILSPEEHDEMIGFLSQLTHCIAVALMTCKESHHLVEYTGDSFRDLTRIARINEDMWTELFLCNKDELLKQMDLFSDQFDKLKKALRDEDTEGMKEMMRLSTLRRSYFDR